MKDNKFKTLTLILTTDCNLNCVYCFCGKKSKRNMDLKNAKMYIDFFHKYSDDEVNVCFFGGEPLLQVKLIADLCEYILSTFGESVHFSVTTNGTLINKSFIDMTKKYNIKMQVSLDGYKESHNRSRKFYNGTGSWSCIMDNIWKYCERFPMVRMTYTPMEIQNLATNVQRLVELGFSEIAFMPTSDRGWDKYKLEVYKEQYEMICDYYYECFMNHKSVYFFEFDNIIRNYILGINSRHICKPGIMQISIDPDGNIYPCNRVNFNDKSLCIGNVLIGFNNHFDIFKEEINEIDKECSNCDLLARCQDCIVENYEGSNSYIKIEDYKCFMNREKIYLIDKMAAKLYNAGNNDFVQRFYDF